MVVVSVCVCVFRLLPFLTLLPQLLQSCVFSVVLSLHLPIVSCRFDFVSNAVQLPVLLVGFLLLTQLLVLRLLVLLLWMVLLPPELR